MYQLRYFFDAGSGICLWATNAEAIHKFGYPIDLSALPLTGETISQGRALIVRFDTSIVWHDPTAPSPWSVAEGVDFQRDSNAFLRLLRDELGAEFDVLSAQCALGEATQTIFRLGAVPPISLPTVIYAPVHPAHATAKLMRKQALR
jgi:hypothetical protein